MINFKPHLLETLYEHAAKHAKGVALHPIDPWLKAFATATEEEMERLAKHLESRYARKSVEDAA